MRKRVDTTSVDSEPIVSGGSTLKTKVHIIPSGRALDPQRFMSFVSLLGLLCVTWVYLSPSVTSLWFSRMSLGMFLVVGGLTHFKSDMIPFFNTLMPTWLPAKNFFVTLTGVCEIVLGLLVMFPYFTNFASWAIILYFISTFPIIINIALNSRVQQQINTTPTAAYVRILVQFLLIVWAYQLTDRTLQDTLSCLLCQAKVAKDMATDVAKDVASSTKDTAQHLSKEYSKDAKELACDAKDLACQAKGLAKDVMKEARNLVK